MSEYGFGYYEGDQMDGGAAAEVQQEQGGPAIKALREKAKADSEALKQMRSELDQLRAKSRHIEVAESLRSKGYDPGAAALYQGEPEKVDEWLASHGSLLAKRPEGEAAPDLPVQQGPPVSTVSAENQAAMQRMQSVGGSDAVTSLGTQEELAAALAAAKTPEEFEHVAKANGWQYSVNGLFG